MPDNEKPSAQASTTTPTAEVKIVAPTSVYIQNSVQKELTVRIPKAETNQKPPKTKE
jgi:hypothetical protein